MAHTRKLARLHFLYLFLFTQAFFSLSLVAQKTIKGRVSDFDTNEPLAFANIIINDEKGTISDAEGFFVLQIDSNTKQFEVSYIGFEKIKIPLNKGQMFYNVKLKATSESLETVVLSGEYVNPAIAIIKEVIEKKQSNDYRKKNKKYSFVKYYKFLLTAEQDSIDPRLDSIFYDGKFAKIDSSQYKFKEELKEKDLFIMESITKVNGLNGTEKNKVVASRTAGFKNPMYEILALQTMNQNIYDANYKFLVKEYLGPLTKQSLKQYKYELNDSVEIQNRKLLVLSYKNTTEPLISGNIYIDKQSKAIAKMTLNTYKQFELRTEHNFIYYPIYDTWFPENATMYIKKSTKSNSVEIGIDGVLRMGTYHENDSISHTNKQNELDYMFANSLTLFKNVQIGKLHPDKITYNLQIAPDAHKKSEEFWNQYRDNKQSKRELKTYTFTDSIAEKEEVEKALQKYRKLAKGYYPTKYFDFNLLQLIDYNSYEGYRVSLGGKTNRNISDKLTLETYLAYGFRDKVLKYKGQVNYKLRHVSQTFLHLGYTKDLEMSAGFGLENKTSNLNLLSNLATDKFYMNTAYELGISHIFTNTLKSKLSLKKQKVELLYNIASLAGIEFRNSNLTTIKLHTEFQPFSKFFLNPEGRIRLKEGFPQFYFNLEKTLPAWQTNYDFFRMDFQANYKKTYLNKQHSDFILKLGYASSGAPLTHTYSPINNGYADRNEAWYTKIHIGNKSSFETLYNLEFANNFLSTAQVSHTFPQLKLGKKNNFDIQLIGRIAWGTSYANNRYTGIKSLEKGYYEAGLELNRLLKFFNQGFGLGFYYRMGNYAYPKPIDNLTIRLTVTPSGFLK